MKLVADLREAVIATRARGRCRDHGGLRAAISPSSTRTTQSPLTAADLAAHRIIVAGLGALTPRLPGAVGGIRRHRRGRCAATGAATGWSIRSTARASSSRRNGEFTVNIALIEDGVPVLRRRATRRCAVTCCTARAAGGAFVRDGDDDVPRDAYAQPAGGAAARRRQPIAPRRAHRRRCSHASARSRPLGLGSSLKFCRIAEGALDVYPRFGPTSEWDTAAGQAVLEAAGGVVARPRRRRRCATTSKDSLLNPDFIALGDPAPALAATGCMAESTGRGRASELLLRSWPGCATATRLPLGPASRTSPASRRTRSRKPTKSPMRSIAATWPTSRTNSATCCCRWCSMRSMAEEAGHFAFGDVVAAICDKMMRRHPHVFGDAAASPGRRGADRWPGKRQEAPSAKPTGEPMPARWPASRAACPNGSARSSCRSARRAVGFDWPDVEPVIAKLHEEIEEVRVEFARRRVEATRRLEDEIGDVLFVVRQPGAARQGRCRRRAAPRQRQVRASLPRAWKNSQRRTAWTCRHFPWTSRTRSGTAPRPRKRRRPRPSCRASAAARGAPAVARLLPVGEENRVRHRRLARMLFTMVAQIRVVVGHAAGQPRGLRQFPPQREQRCHLSPPPAQR